MIHRKYRDAAALYQKILERDRQSAFALTELIKCYAEFDLDTFASPHLEVPAVEDDAVSIDVGSVHTTII